MNTSFALLIEEIRKLDPLPNWAKKNWKVGAILYEVKREIILNYLVEKATRQEVELRLWEANAVKKTLLAAEGRKAAKVFVFDVLFEGIDPLALSPEDLGAAIKEIRQSHIEACAVCGRAIKRYPYCDGCGKETTLKPIYGSD